MMIHEGHRQRLINRFRQEGLEHFDQRHVLELLLFYSVPRKDTAPMAQALLDHFGSLSQVLEAPAEELEKVPGVGPSTATLLTLTMAVGRYYEQKRDKNELRYLTTVEECGKFLLPYLRDLRNEAAYLLCLDAKCKPLCCQKLGEGSVNSAAIPIRRIVEVALAVNATTVVLAHNHPSGLAFPSGDDVQTTFRVAKALDPLEISLADHIIVAENDFVSLAQSGYYSLAKCRAMREEE